MKKVKKAPKKKALKKAEKKKDLKKPAKKKATRRELLKKKKKGTKKPVKDKENNKKRGRISSTDLIKKLMADEGISIRDLAAKAGCSPTTVQNSRQKESIRLTTFVLLAEQIGCKVFVVKGDQKWRL